MAAIDGRPTLLEIVQEVLSDLNDDEVESISDTVESLQIAQIAEGAYFELLANKNWPHLNKLDHSLTETHIPGTNRTQHPTAFDVPHGMKELLKVDYRNDDGSYTEMSYVQPDEWLTMTAGIKDTTPNTETSILVDGEEGYKIYNDRDPKCYTSFNDNTLIFDAYIDPEYQAPTGIVIPDGGDTIYFSDSYEEEISDTLITDGDLTVSFKFNLGSLSTSIAEPTTLFSFHSEVPGQIPGSQNNVSFRVVISSIGILSAQHSTSNSNTSATTGALIGGFTFQANTDYEMVIVRKNNNYLFYIDGVVQNSGLYHNAPQVVVDPNDTNPVLEVNGFKGFGEWETTGRVSEIKSALAALEPEEFSVLKDVVSNPVLGLDGSRLRIYYSSTPEFDRTDNDLVPDLPVEAFPAYLAEIKSISFFRIKDVQDQKSEQQARRQRNWLSRKAFIAGGGIELPTYARRRTR